MAVFDNLLLRYCPSLDSSGNGTTTLNQLDAGGAVVSGGAHMTLTNMETADWVADTTTGGVRALELDGSNEYLISNSTTAGNLGTSDASIMVHAKLTSGARSAIIVGKRNTSGPFAMWLLLQGHLDTSGSFVASSKISIFWYNGGALNASGAMSYCTANDVVDGNWHHIGVSRTNGAAPKIYIDGVNQSLTAIIAGTSNFSGDNSIPAQIGRSSGGNNYAPMRFDDLLIFNAAKSAGGFATLAAKRGYLDAVVETRRRRQSVSGGAL